MSLFYEGLRGSSGVSVGEILTVPEKPVADSDYGQEVDPHALGLTTYSFIDLWKPHSIFASQEVPPLILNSDDIQGLQAEKQAFQQDGHDLGIAWLSALHAVDPRYLASRINHGKSDVRHNNGEDPFPIDNLKHQYLTGGWFSFRISDEPEMMGKTVAMAEAELQNTGRRLPTLSEFLLMALVIHDAKPQNQQSSNNGWPDVGYGLRSIIPGSTIEQSVGNEQFIGAKFHPIKKLQLFPLVTKNVCYSDVGVRPIRPLPQRKLQPVSK